MTVGAVGYTPGSGVDVAGDTAGGLTYQLLKLAFGTEGNATLVSASDPFPITAASLPLPSGAATQATLAAIETALGGTLDVSVSGSVAVTGTFWQATQPVSAASLPLPSGAATEATLAAISGQLPAALTGAGNLKVDINASTATVPVSGTFWQATQPVSIAGTVAISAAALPLPSNAAQETGGNLAAAVTALQIIDDWDESDRAKVNPIVGQAGVAAGSGNVGSTVQRVVIATDQPQLTNKLLVTPDANSAVNISQMNGVTVTMNSGNTGTGVQRVVIATDQPSFTNAMPISMSAAATTSIAKAEDALAGSGDVGAMVLAVQTATPADAAADNDYAWLQLKGGRLWVSGSGFISPQTDVTRPNDTNAYAINDAVANSTSSPTSGGFTLSNAARFSGGSGVIKDITVVYSTQPATPPQLEVWVFNQSVTAINDNAAFTITDAEAKTVVAIIPVTCNIPGGSANYIGQATGLEKGFTCVGSANLRYLLKAKVAWTPAAQDVITVTATIEYKD